MFSYKSGYIQVQLKRQQLPLLTKIFFYVLVIAAFLFFNYNPQSFISNEIKIGWIFSIFCSFLIFLIMKHVEPVKWKHLLGIYNNTQNIFMYPVVLLLLFVGFGYWISYTAESNGYYYSPSLITYYIEKKNGNTQLQWMNIIPLYLYHIPQTFNEEMISGALLLKKAKQLLSRFHDMWVAAIISAIFSAAHIVFYLVTPAQQGTLTLFAVISLFFVGWIRNTLILTTGNIYYAWMLHLTWNILFFPSFYFIKFTSYVIKGETARINLILGDEKTVIIAFLISIAIGIWSYYYHLKKKPDN